MINVSGLFEQGMESGTKYKEYAEVTLADGRKLILDEDNFTASNNSITDGAGGTRAFPLGVAVQKYVQLEIINDHEQYKDCNFLGARIRLLLTFTVLENKGPWLDEKGEPILDHNYEEIFLYAREDEKVEKGSYTVITPETYGETIIITAYDDMYKADAPYVTNLEFPQTTGAMLRDICLHTGISLGSASFLNDDFVVREKPSGTFRQVLGYIAEIAAGNARIDINGKLQILTWDFSGFGTGTFHTLKNFNPPYPKCDTDDAVITGVKTTVEPGATGEEETILAGTDAYVITIKNPLIAGGEEKVLRDILDIIGNVPLRPFEGELVANPLIEFMDLAKVEDRRGESYNTVITDVNFVFFGLTSIKNTAPGAQRTDLSYGNPSDNAEARLKKLLKRERSERQKAIEGLNKELEESSGLYQTEVRMPDASTILYLHDKPNLDESKTVIKVTAQAIGISTDGGKNYPTGIKADGEAIIKILQTIGVNADWINTGAIVVRDINGNVLFLADIDTGRVEINADVLKIAGKSVQDMITQETEAIVGAVAEDLQVQIDGKIESYCQEADPSLEWAEAACKDHAGDIWKQGENMFRWDGEKWEDYNNADDAARKLAELKARVFSYAPVPPYKAGDMWVTSTEDGKAEYRTCIQDREAGELFSSADWINPQYVNSGDVEGAIKDYDTSLGQGEVFNKLTNGQKDQGIYAEDGKIYINASYILAGVLAGKFINAKGMNVKDSDGNSTFCVDDGGNVDIRARSFNLSGKTIKEIAEEALDDASTNLIKGYKLTSEDISTYWDVAGQLTYSQSDPAGGTQAVRLYGTSADCFISAKRSKNQVIYTPGRYTFSVWLKSTAARTVKISFNRESYECAVTASWQRFSFTQTVTSIAPSYQLFTIGGFGSVGAGVYVYAYHPEAAFEMSSEDYFNILTDNGKEQGIYMKDGRLYVNATYIDTGLLAGWRIDKEKQTLTSPGENVVIDAKNEIIRMGSEDYGAYMKSGESWASNIKGNSADIGTNGINDHHVRINSMWGQDDSTMELTAFASMGAGNVGMAISSGSGSNVVISATEEVGIGSGKMKLYHTSSAKKYKNHVRDMTLDDVKGLYDVPLAWFRYKEGTIEKGDAWYHKDIPGLYADDIAKLFPMGAVYNKDGAAEDWTDKTLLPAVLMLVQSQKRMIDDLIRRVQRLENTRKGEDENGTVG